LGLKKHASQQEIKKAYRGLVKKHHPDCFKNGSEFQLKIATEKFIEIQHAYELLSHKKA
jgi:molecular chaperone DnaJ